MTQLHSRRLERVATELLGRSLSDSRMQSYPNGNVTEDLSGSTSSSQPQPAFGWCFNQATVSSTCLQPRS